MKRFILFLTILSISTRLFAQSCDLNATTIELNSICTPIQNALSTGNCSIEARDGIILKQGFQLASSQYQLHSFIAKVDHSYANQNTAYLPSTVNGTTPTLDKSNCIPGTIGGAVNVSPSGAASFQLPIQVSPGSHGVQPNLSIVYSSQAGNGLLGWGWNIAGLSSISRVNKNLYYDGTINPISLTNDDAFVLDGERLIAGSTPGTYYPASNPYTVVVKIGETFSVTTQDGTVMEYGKEGNSVGVAAGINVPISWAISRITDHDGNYIKFIYASDNSTGEFKISAIKYTGNSKTGKEPYNSVMFYYDKRIDTNNSYVAGGSMSQSALLTSIQVICEGSLSKKYDFSYFYDTYSKLYKISLTADGVTYNPTTINWNSITNNTIASVDTQLGSMNDDNPIYTGDFNGDGLIDIAKWNKVQNTISVSIAQLGGGYTLKTIDISTCYPTLNSGYSIEIKDIKVLDKNNDGKDDIVIHFTETPITDPGQIQKVQGLQKVIGRPMDLVRYFSYVNGSFSPCIESTNSSDGDFKHYYGDFNNDGIIDHLTVLDGTVISCNYSVGSSVVSLTVPTTIVNANEIQLIDFNGDGRTEILTLSDDGYGSILEYNGTTFVNIYGNSTSTFFGKPQNFFTGDFNGDGKTDYLSYYSGVWHLFYSTGTGFTLGTAPNLQNIEPALTGIASSGSFNAASTICIDDLNKDGKADICQAVNGNVNVFLSNGNDFVWYTVTPSTLTNNSEISLQSVDLNNNGEKELLYGIKHYNDTATPVTEPYKLISFSNDFRYNQLVNTITDGLNNSYSFTYSSYTDNREFTSTFVKPDYPLQLLRGPMVVVHNLKSATWNSTLSDITYGYADGYSHIGGLGFLGFKKDSSSNSINGVSSVSNYSYTIPGVPKIYHTWLKKQVSKKGSVTSWFSDSITAVKPDTLKKSYYLLAISTKKHDGFTNITTTSTIDSFDEIKGRVTASTTSAPAVNSASGWTVSTSTTFEVVSGNISKPTAVTSTRTHGSDTYSSTSSLTYDTQSPLRVKSTTAGGVTTNYDNFDSYGNPIVIRITSADGERISSCTTDNYGRFVTSTTDALGRITSFQYRSSDGAKIFVGTPNGNTTYAYNGQSGKRTITTTYPDGNIGTSEIGWTGRGLYNKESITNGNTVTTYLSSAGQKNCQTVLGFSGVLLTSEYTYYPNGSLHTEKLPGIATPNTYNYYDDGRLQSVTDYKGATVSYTYIDNKVITTSSISGTVTQTLDAMGNTTKVDGANGVIDYNYFASGKVNGIVIGGDTTSMTYNRLTLNQETLTDPDAGTTSYTYSGFGELLTQTDSRQKTITCSYKPATGQLLTKTGEGVDEEYTYYGSDSPKQNGLLHTARRSGVTETYTYDDLGRPLTVSTTSNGKTYTTAMQYDSEKRLGIVKYPTGMSVKYVYDEVGNLKEIDKLNADNTTTLIWQGKPKNERQQWTEFTLGNGLTTKLHYDNTTFMLDSIKTGTLSSPRNIQNLGFDFNPKGQLVTRTDNTLSESFGYDEQNRLLTSTIGNKTVRSTYQDNGNILNTSLAGDFTYDVPGKPHAVGSISGPADTIGHALNAVVTSSHFTSDNRIADMDNTKYKNVFTYAPSGSRFQVERYTDGVKTSTKFYVGPNEFVIVGSDTTKRTMIYAPTGICAVWEKVGTKDSLYYIHTDNQGSWLKITNQNGKLENSYSYDAWGRPRNPKTWQLLPVSLTDALVDLNSMQPRFDRGYTGHEHMAGFGLINMNGRLYDPYLQRFLSPDNVVQAPDNAQNYNRYSYCMNNPLMYTDPTGWKMAAADQYWNLGAENDCFINFSGQRACSTGSNGDASSGWGNIGASTGGWGGVGGAVPNIADAWLDSHVTYPGAMDDLMGSLWNATSSNGAEQFTNVQGEWYNTGTMIITGNLNNATASLNGGGKAEADKPYSIPLEKGLSINVELNNNLKPGYYNNYFSLDISVNGKNYSGYNWVQTCNYWRDDWHNDLRNGWTNDGLNNGFCNFTNDGTFYDTPTADSFCAYLTLVGKTGDQWSTIATFTWGYATINGEHLIYFYQIFDVPSRQMDNINSALKNFNP